MDSKKLAGKNEKLNRLLKLKLIGLFEDMELTAMQALTLEYVMSEACEGRDVFQKDLEAVLFIRGSSVSSIVNNLVARSLVQRIPADFDGRFKLLVPTRRAWDLRPGITSRLDAYNDQMFAGIEESDLSVYESVLEQMTKNAMRR